MLARGPGTATGGGGGVFGGREGVSGKEVLSAAMLASSVSSSSPLCPVISDPCTASLFGLVGDVRPEPPDIVLLCHWTVCQGGEDTMAMFKC